MQLFYGSLIIKIGCMPCDTIMYFAHRLKNDINHDEVFIDRVFNITNVLLSRAAKATLKHSVKFQCPLWNSRHQSGTDCWKLGEMKSIQYHLF